MAAAVACGAPAGGAAPAAAPAPPSDAAAVVAEADRMAAAELWPGFDPRALPMAIFDGERTLLFRHPSPPDGFEPVADRSDVFVHHGRYDAVVANTAVEIGGSLTATLVPAARDTPLRQRAATLIHEAFHVHQRTQHPGWMANEVELFTYPIDDPELLALRRLESGTFAAALAWPDEAGTRCRAAAALELRAARFGRMPDGAAAYERMTELVEGLATYVEFAALGIADPDIVPTEPFPADQVRQRAYVSGTAIARLLDRLDAGWREALIAADTVLLDELLAGALAGEAGGADCAPGAEEVAAARARAVDDVGALAARRAADRERFLAQPGWTLVLEAAGAPLFPQQFDPVNVQALGNGEVLHTRMLRLAGDAGSVELLGRSALTVAAGPHPLFSGVRRVTITGLEAEPRIGESAGVVSLEARGVRAEFRGASVERAGTTVVLRLAAP